MCRRGVCSSWDFVTFDGQVSEMETKEQVAAAFKADLQALLDKYGAELEATDHWQGYSECGEDVRMTVDIPAIYDSEYNCLREFTEVDLGSHLWPNEKAVKGGE